MVIRRWPFYRMVSGVGSDKMTTRCLCTPHRAPSSGETYELPVGLSARCRHGRRLVVAVDRLARQLDHRGRRGPLCLAWPDRRRRGDRRGGTGGAGRAGRVGRGGRVCRGLRRRDQGRRQSPRRVLAPWPVRSWAAWSAYSSACRFRSWARWRRRWSLADWRRSCGAFMAETAQGRDFDTSLSVGKAAFLGRIFGTLGKMIVGSVMVVVTLAALCSSATSLREHRHLPDYRETRRALWPLAACAGRCDRRRDHDPPFWLVGRVEQFAAEGHGDDLVGVAVNLQEWPVESRDDRRGVQFVAQNKADRQPGIMHRAHVSQRAERVFQDQGPGAVVGRQLDHHAAAERFAHQHDLRFVYPGPLSQPTARRPGIVQHAGYRRISLAATVAAVVEHQHATRPAAGTAGSRYPPDPRDCRRCRGQTIQLLADCLPADTNRAAACHRWP